MHISSCIFLFVDLIRVALHDLRFEIILIYLRLGFVEAPRFMCFKQILTFSDVIQSQEEEKTKRSETCGWQCRA